MLSPHVSCRLFQVFAHVEEGVSQSRSALLCKLMASSAAAVTGKRVCVVGAGPSGLTSIRQLRDEGIEAVCYEKSDSLGGLWCYRDEVVEGLPSVARTTIVNTSKEYAAFSDFPPPDHFPNYMHNTIMVSRTLTMTDCAFHLGFVACVCS